MQVVLTMKNKNVKINFVENAKEFVGLKIENGKVELYVPQVFRVDDSSAKDILIFLKSISLSSAINKENIRRGTDQVKEIWPFDSYVWIIRDFIENGFYYNREKVYSTNNGKIEWKKTMRNIPIVSSGNLIYNKLVTSKMSPCNDFTAQIYRLCLKQSIDRIGWLYNYNVQIEIQQIFSMKEMIHRVQQEITNTNDDVRKLRFKHMLKILKNSEGENMISSSCSYGITNYHHVFEKMVDMFFGGLPDKKKERYYPKGKWKFNKEYFVDSSPLRPDTIFIKNKKTYIIDAKMYQYGFSHNINDLPGTRSIQKQITYGDHAYNVLKEENVRNIFVLPYNKELLLFKQDNDIKYFDLSDSAFIGDAYAPWRNDRPVKDYYHIYTFLIDFNYLLKNYNNNFEQMKEFSEYLMNL